MTNARPTLSPEARLLLLTAAEPPDRTAIRAALDAVSDSEYLVGLALHEKAASVLVSELDRAGLALPDLAAGELQLAARVSTMHMLQLEHLLHQALDTLGKCGIEAMLLKGAGLGYTVYPSFAHRPMSDLDLLVRPEDAERAWSELQAAGWTWPSEVWAAERYTAHHHLPPLVKDPGGFRIEIHTDLVARGHPFGLAPSTLWERARRLTIDGRVLTVPDPVHQLWHACVHFAWSHELQWGSWRTFRDCAALCDKGEIDWGEFSRFAVESRAGTCCYWTLRLARGLVGAPVPGELLLALRPPGPDFLLDQLERHYVCSLFPSADRCPSTWLSCRLWEAGIRPAWSAHGHARPWQTTDRWAAGVETGQGVGSQSGSLTARLASAGGLIRYLLRIHRFALPSNAT